jgi:hypothetical protein
MHWLLTLKKNRKQFMVVINTFIGIPLNLW